MVVRGSYSRRAGAGLKDCMRPYHLLAMAPGPATALAVHLQASSLIFTISGFRNLRAAATTTEVYYTAGCNLQQARLYLKAKRLCPVNVMLRAIGA